MADNLINMFDGTPSYSMFTSVLTASTEGDTSLAAETMVIDITCHQNFTYSNVFYIDFGSNI